MANSRRRRQKSAPLRAPLQPGASPFGRDLTTALNVCAHPFASLRPARQTLLHLRAKKSLPPAAIDGGFAAFDRSDRGALEAIDRRYFEHLWRLEQAGYARLRRPKSHPKAKIQAQSNPAPTTRRQACGRSSVVTPSRHGASDPAAPESAAGRPVGEVRQRGFGTYQHLSECSRHTIDGWLLAASSSVAEGALECQMGF